MRRAIAQRASRHLEAGPVTFIWIKIAQSAGNGLVLLGGSTPDTAHVPGDDDEWEYELDHHQDDLSGMRTT